MFHTTNLPCGAKNETIYRMGKDTIENNIKTFRQSLGLTQEEFGKPLNANRADMSRYEKGKHLTVRLLLDIERIYGVPIGSLLHKENGKKIPLTSSSVDPKLMLDCWEAILKAAKSRNRKLSEAEEHVYPIMLYNHIVECRSSGIQAEPSETLAILILKEKAA